MPSAQEIVNAIDLIEEVAFKYGHDDVYFVGGYPRTIAMGLPISDVHDLDIASGRPGRSKELAGFFAEEAKADELHQHHRTTAVTVSVGNLEIDFQGSEDHEHVAPYVRLWGVPETPIAMNIFDRDFTMNSLAVKVGTTNLLDITKRGLRDIQEKVVASIIPPELKVREDPLLITRAIRMSVKYGFTIDKDLWKAMKKNSGLLERKLSPHRLAIEAYVLSKYPGTKVLIEMLGIKYLESPEIIEIGEESTEE
jgi:tRNA nucleotidyltransferase/poly(A) polymerase